jgi:hypothetical protein
MFFIRLDQLDRKMVPAMIKKQHAPSTFYHFPPMFSMFM